tara:strand:+ start:2482 stop:3060 length:579 start_codon:yes stop_codon:yes gene_type:complete
MERNPKRLFATAIAVFTLGFLGRIVLHDYSNFETIMVATFLSALVLPRNWTFIITISMIVASDIYLGYFGGSKIILFTYSGFLFVSFLTSKFENSIHGDFKPNTVYKFGASGIILTLTYDIWTNFGVFLLTYNHTLENLILVYILGLPFMLYHLISSLITFTLIGFPFYIISLHGLNNSLEIEDESISHEQN